MRRNNPLGAYNGHDGAAVWQNTTFSCYNVLGILSNQVRDGFFEKGSFGLSGLKREICELLSNTRETTDVDLPEFLACLALPWMSTVDVLCLAENFSLLFRSRG